MEAKHSVELAASKASFDELCMKILRLITVDNAAFRLVDRPEFHALFPPHARMPTRYQLSKVVMPSMVQSLRDNISSRLAGRRCTLTVDQWTSKGGRITLSCFNARYVNDKASKTTNLTPVNEEIERYIYENSRRVVDVDNSVKYWLSPAGSFYPTIKDMALKMLPIPATSVSAERVFSAAGLLDKQRLRNNLSAETIKSCLLLRLNYIGDRARELSCKPPPVLVPNSSCTSIDSASAPVEETYGYLSDDSEIEEFESDDELEL